jgi:hypothetical protein
MMTRNLRSNGAKDKKLMAQNKKGVRILLKNFELFFFNGDANFLNFALVRCSHGKY